MNLYTFANNLGENRASEIYGHLSDLREHVKNSYVYPPENSMLVTWVQLFELPFNL